MAFNSREYEWADMSLILGGGDMVEIRGVKYKEKMEKEPLHAKGRDPHSIQSGNRTYEGEIVLLQSGYDKLVLAGGGSVLNLNLLGMVAYGNPSTGDAIRTKSMTAINFTEAENGMKQGDKFMEVTLPFICLNINQLV